MIVVNGIYQHYKGNYYKVLGVPKSSETLEDMIVYQDLCEENKIWVRPASMWEETVKTVEGPVPRFRLVEMDK